MKALLLEKVGSAGLVDVPPPEAAEGEKLLKVTHCALCRTDAKMWRQGHRDLRTPRVLGHEVCGVAQDTGRRFVAWPGQACGSCSACRRGRENLCPEMCILGFHRDGGLAERIAVPEASLIPVPGGLPGALACLAEPMACALNAMDQVCVEEGNRVLVYGAGTLGLMLAFAARSLGARPMVVEANPAKIRLGESFCHRLEIPCTGAPGDDGFHVAVNAAPDKGIFLDALSRLVPGGAFCFFSGLVGESSIPMKLFNEIHYRQLRLAGAYGCTRDQMRRALDLLTAYRGTAALLIQEKIRVEEVPGKWDQILSGKGYRIVVEMQP